MSSETCAATENLIEHVRGHFAPNHLELIKRACAFAEDHFEHIKHPTGKPYIQYASEVAKLLDNLGADHIVISAVMVYSPQPMSDTVLDEVKKKFKGENELINLVEEVLHLGWLEWNIWPTPLENDSFRERKETLQKMFLLAIDDTYEEGQEINPLTAVYFQKKEKQVENLICMFLAAATDIRALIIKLADRLHFIKLLKDLPPSQQKLIHYTLLARMTLAVYAPLADRLGMWQLKSGLEDMSFRLLDMETFKKIAVQLDATKKEREKCIDDIIPIIRAELEAFGIKAEIAGRAKHIYSIYQKMEAKQLTFEQINDLLGIRIIVDNIEDCYNVQSILHEFWPPQTAVYYGKAGRDWIVNPKANLYQSLHTTIKVKDKIVEIQIRTREMHEIAEYGVGAAHWRYKESKAYRKDKTHVEAWMKDRNQQLAERRKLLTGEQGATIPTLKDPINDRIFAITPEGHVIDLPAGATPLDFAYRIHTTLGHMYVGAKVGDRLVRSDYVLKNGDTVEILTSRTRKGPNPEWLSKSKDMDGQSKYVRTRQARSKIQNWLNKQKPKALS